MWWDKTEELKVKIDKDYNGTISFQQDEHLNVQRKYEW